MRNRILKEGFFRNYELACLPPLVRILFQGLWCMADREGRLVDQPPRIKADVLPYDDCDVDAMLSTLHEAGFILRYRALDRSYILVVNFTKHQSLTTFEKTKTTSDIPPPPFSSNSERPAESVQTQNRSTSEVSQNGDRSKSERSVRVRDSAKAGGDPPRIWDVGVPLLTRGGMAERDARSLLGRLAKQFGNQIVAEAIAKTDARNAANPHEYLIAVLTREQTPRNQAELNRGGRGFVQ